MTGNAIPVRRLDVEIQLGQGSFGEGGFDSVTLTGYRVSASLVMGADPSFSEGQVRIWGLDPSLMNKISTLGKPAFFDRVNVVTISAGDDQTGVSQVYKGIIQEAFQDFNDAPNACINIQTHAGAVNSTKPVKPTSYPGPVSAANAMANIAANWVPNALQLENNGVDVMLPGGYFPGTLVDQMRRIKEAANIEAAVDGSVLAIWPKGGQRGGLIPDVGPDSGLVGYPQFDGSGRVRLTSLFKPGFRVNGTVNLSTSLTSAAGQYQITALLYELEAELPGGKWFAHMDGVRPGALA